MNIIFLLIIILIVAFIVPILTIFNRMGGFREKNKNRQHKKFMLAAKMYTRDIIIIGLIKSGVDGITIAWKKAFHAIDTKEDK